MQAGASAQFSAVPLNLVAFWIERRRRAVLASLGGSGDESAVLERVRADFQQSFRMDYLVTGSWSLKASQEAALLFEPLGTEYVNVALDARKAGGGKFVSIPEENWTLSQQPGFVYYCDNETVDGVEFPSFPAQLEKLSQEGESIIVADMSSNILSRPVDVSKFGALFFGAQKNISSAGLTVAYAFPLSPDDKKVLSILVSFAKIFSPLFRHHLSYMPWVSGHLQRLFPGQPSTKPTAYTTH